MDWSCALGGLAVPVVSRSWVEHWRAIALVMGQTGTPVDTERTVVRDYGFPVWFEKPAMALVCPVWLGGVAGMSGCTAHVAGLLLGWAAFTACGGCKIFWQAPQYRE